MVVQNEVPAIGHPTTIMMRKKPMQLQRKMTRMMVTKSLIVKLMMRMIRMMMAEMNEMKKTRRVRRIKMARMMMMMMMKVMKVKVKVGMKVNVEMRM